MLRLNIIWRAEHFKNHSINIPIKHLYFFFLLWLCYRKPKETNVKSFMQSIRIRFQSVTTVQTQIKQLLRFYFPPLERKTASSTHSDWISNKESQRIKYDRNKGKTQNLIDVPILGGSGLVSFSYRSAHLRLQKVFTSPLLCCSLLRYYGHTIALEVQLFFLYVLGKCLIC